MRARNVQGSRGFSLVELAVVVTIVALLLGTLMYTLSAQTEQRNLEETRRRLEVARELLLSYAIVNGRLPCPARSNSVGMEVRNAAGECKNTGSVEDYYGGPVPEDPPVIGGLLPAVTIGFQPVDAQGFAVDVWSNRIRYAVAKAVAPTDCAGPLLPHFTHASNMKKNGITCKPNDLIVCNVSQAWAVGTACSAGTAVTNKETIVFVVMSTGKNGAIGAGGANEAANLDGGGNLDALFVSRTPDPVGSAGGEFDDLLLWVPVGAFYGRLIAAGMLP